MKAFIFISPDIKKPKSQEPCVIIQHDSPSVRILRVNRVRIDGPCELFTSGDPNPKIRSHEVRAWIECDSGDVEVTG